MAHDDSTHTGHPIGVVTARTGLSRHVLRAWERRYSVVLPRRNKTGRRVYSDADVERLTLLHRATRAGRPVASVVDMPTDLLRTIVADDAAGAGERPSASRSHGAEAMLAVRDLDTTRLTAVLRRALLSLGTISFLEDVVGPLMVEIGTEWHAGRITVAQEHAASATVMQLLGALVRELEVPSAAPRLVMATPLGEDHAVGALMAAAAAAHDGWHVTWLGANLPASQVAAAAAPAQARVVALSVASGTTIPERELQELRQALPPDIPLLVGGAGADRLTSAESLTRVRDLSHWRSLLHLHAPVAPA